MENNWQCLSLTPSINKAKNEEVNKRLRMCEELVEKRVPEAAAASTCNPLTLCSKCSTTGMLVLCDKFGCSNRYHWHCLGLKVNDPDAQQFFCEACNPKFLKDLLAKRKSRGIKNEKQKRYRAEKEEKVT